MHNNGSWPFIGRDSCDPGTRTIGNRLKIPIFVTIFLWKSVILFQNNGIDC